jgi:hypothetical protein
MPVRVGMQASDGWTRGEKNGGVELCGRVVVLCSRNVAKATEKFKPGPRERCGGGW